METKAGQSSNDGSTPPPKDRPNDNGQGQPAGSPQVVQPMLVDASGRQIPFIVQVSPSVDGVPLVSTNVVHTGAGVPPGSAEPTKIHVSAPSCVDTTGKENTPPSATH